MLPMGCGDHGEAFSDCVGFGHKWVMEGEGAFHSRAGGVCIFVQMNFGDTVVVEADCLADSILRDFESAIQISPKGGFEIKPDGKRNRLAS